MSIRYLFTVKELSRFSEGTFALHWIGPRIHGADFAKLAATSLEFDAHNRTQKGAATRPF